MKVAVIGSGMAGLTAARILDTAGVQVTVFDKSKGTGGRLSSRSFEGGWIDHGAPYFSTERPGFSEFLRQHVPAASLEPWQPHVMGSLGTDEQPHLIGVPRSSAITRGLLGDLRFQPSTRVARLVSSADGWQLFNDGESLLGCWPQVVIAVPAPQALALLREEQSLAEAIGSVKMEPCWVTAVRSKTKLTEKTNISAYEDPVVHRVINNSAKPGRLNSDVYLVQATKSWSIAHLEDIAENIGRDLQKRFDHLVSSDGFSEILFSHRWRYAFTESALGRPCLWDAELGLGVCGDWCLGRQVEDAWQSGADLAVRMLKHFEEEKL
jgi:predicted NAD/FAD-dependent oxidoreductase